MLSNLCYFNKINLKQTYTCNLKTEVNKVKVMYLNKTQVLNNTSTSVNLFTLNFEKRN